MSFEKGNAGSSGGMETSTGDSEGEDQDDPSSTSSNLTGDTVQNALESFRQQWQRELNITPKHKPQQDLHKNTVEQIINKSDDVETKARILFLNGVEHEQKGKLYEAIQFYRRAVQLVPDIEFKLYESSKTITRGARARNDTVQPKDEFSEPLKEEFDSDEEGSGDVDLYTRLQRKIFKNHVVCLPQYEQKNTHISCLPLEIILYILRWVVTSDLDLKSLECCARVCRGFYICCRDSEIWRLVCARVWGVNCGNSPEPYSSWREMYVDRPRLQYTGCYISKTTYFRHGENSFQDQYYRPWHLVEYYRYLRFFPEGKVLMLTTPEEPMQSVGQLRHRNPRHAGVLAGHYRLWNNTVTILVQRQDKHNIKIRNRRRDVEDYCEQTFHLELQIQNHRKKKNVYLTWSRYSVFTRNSNGAESNTTFEIVGNKFPALWFSRVKSYTAEADTALH